MRKVIGTGFAVATLLLATPATAETISGLPYLTDADTITISGTKIRLAGIDAPEMAQTCLDAKGAPYRCGAAAREALTAFAAGKVWTCELQAKRLTYKRRVGSCSVAGKDVQRWLVREGWALDWPKYSHGLYAKDEAAARTAKRGLWSGSLHAPWNWRHRTCATTILGAYSVPIDAREKLCKPPPKHPRKRRT